MSFNERPQYPLNGLGQRMQEASIGIEKLVFAGQGTPAPGAFSGVGTAYGAPGVFVSTRVATGIYDIRHDSNANVEFFPSISAPSGVAAYQVHFENRLGQAQNTPNTPSGYSGSLLYDPKGGVSGVTRMVITQQQIQGATILNTPVNPPSGMVVNLLVLSCPVRPF